MDVWKKMKEGTGKDATCKTQPELEGISNNPDHSVTRDKNTSTSTA